MARTRRKFRATVSSLLIGGAVAQLGERLVRNEEVRGSNPLGSTIYRQNSLVFLSYRSDWFDNDLIGFGQFKKFTTNRSIRRRIPGGCTLPPDPNYVELTFKSEQFIDANSTRTAGDPQRKRDQACIAKARDHILGR